MFTTMIVTAVSGRLCLSDIWAQPQDLGSGGRQLTAVAVASISASVEHKHGGQVQIISMLQPIIPVQEAKVKVGYSICALSICCFHVPTS